ncbi:MAG: tRNA pseudouridine(38-40) synthase TruA [Opitutaceae bacterium]
MTAFAPKIQRWKCVCAYDGTAFAGWQSQARSNAVQDLIEKRIAQIFQTPIRIHGSGRTDSGVHARAQVFHFDAEWKHGVAKLLAAFRVGLPATIQVKSVRAVAGDFHARFDARAKRYEYQVQLGDADPFHRAYCWSVFRPLDFAAMQEAAAVLRGRHDFRAFTALDGQGESPENTVRHLRRLDLVKKGRSIRITAEAEGFLYKMMRSLVGLLVRVGEGKISLAEVRTILASKERTHRVLTAPPQGLFLVKVFYS